MNYVDPDDHDPAPVNVAFSEAETRRIYAVAEGYAQHCITHGRTPPENVMLALLEAAENMAARLAFIAEQYEVAMLAEWGEGGLPN